MSERHIATIKTSKQDDKKVSESHNVLKMWFAKDLWCRSLHSIDF